MDFLDKPYNKLENSIGRSIHETIHGFTGSQAEEQNKIIQQQMIDIEKLRLKTVFDNLPVSVVIFDRNGQVVEINNITFQMLGFKTSLPKSDLQI